MLSLRRLARLYEAWYAYDRWVVEPAPLTSPAAARRYWVENHSFSIFVAFHHPQKLESMYTSLYLYFLSILEYGIRSRNTTVINARA
jgi:hypothetical protein